ncbi:MAG: DsrE/DsrF/DrsH-like family protein [Nitrososphaerales archaeon]
MGEQRKKMLYVQTSGVDTPERLYAPLILAATAAATDIDATVYFVIKGVTALKKGEAEKIKIGNFPALKEVLDQALKSGVKIMACERSCQLLGIPRDEILSEAKLVGAATLNDLVLEADGVQYF